jgi:hypothetical protein
MEDTGFRMVHQKPHRELVLMAKLNYFPDEQKGPITRAEFLARAWKLANDKARELRQVLWMASTRVRAAVRRWLFRSARMPT